MAKRFKYFNEAADFARSFASYTGEKTIIRNYRGFFIVGTEKHFQAMDSDRDDRNGPKRTVRVHGSTGGETLDSRRDLASGYMREQCSVCGGAGEIGFRCCSKCSGRGFL